MSDIICTVTPELVTEEPGIIRITYNFELPDHINTFVFTFLDSGMEIFTQCFEVDGQSCKWTAGNTRTPTIEIRFGLNEGSGATSYVDTGQWAITRLPNLGWQWSYNPSVDAPELVEQHRLRGEGAISTDGAVAYLGPHEEYTETARGTGEEFRLVVPRDANLRDDPSSILSALTRASELLQIGALNESVLAIAAPTNDQNWASKGNQRGDSGFWVRDDAATDETNETWVHEYVHTRQHFRKTDATFWFKEGTADYFASLAALERKDIGFDRFHRFLTRHADAGAVLADPGTWSSKSTAYRQGRRTCAALDLRIREVTSGSRTLMDVVARLNENVDDFPDLSNSSILQALEHVTDRSMDNWFEKYVHGDRAPTVAEDRSSFIDSIRTSKPEPGVEPKPEAEPEPESPPEPELVAEVEPESEAIHICPTCNTETTDRYCPTCGHEFEMGATSPQRGSLPDGECCPICETETIEELCPTCGHDMAPRCPVCDAVGAPHDDYCNTCGKDLRR